jgi:hypothetical protein
MRKQYHFWPGPVGTDAWDVDGLVERTKDLPVLDVAIDSIAEIDSEYWFITDDQRPTVRQLVDHFRLIQDVDLSYPIILGHDGRVMDGMHRIARSLLDGATTIRAVRLDPIPEPDFPNCRPEDLRYD